MQGTPGPPGHSNNEFSRETLWEEGVGYMVKV